MYKYEPEQNNLNNRNIITIPLQSAIVGKTPNKMEAHQDVSERGILPVGNILQCGHSVVVLDGTLGHGAVPAFVGPGENNTEGHDDEHLPNVGLRLGME